MDGVILGFPTTSIRSSAGPSARESRDRADRFGELYGLGESKLVVKDTFGFQLPPDTALFLAAQAKSYGGILLREGHCASKKEPEKPIDKKGRKPLLGDREKLREATQEDVLRSTVRKLREADKGLSGDLPEAEELASEIVAYRDALASEGDLEPEPGEESVYGEFRLQVVPGEGWSTHEGDPQYDTDHRGHWGSIAVSPDMTDDEAKELAQDLIDQVEDSYAQSEEGPAEEPIEEPPGDEEGAGKEPKESKAPAGAKALKEQEPEPADMGALPVPGGGGEEGEDLPPLPPMPEEPPTQGGLSIPVHGEIRIGEGIEGYRLQVDPGTRKILKAEQKMLPKGAYHVLGVCEELGAVSLSKNSFLSPVVWNVSLPRLQKALGEEQEKLRLKTECAFCGEVIREGLSPEGRVSYSVCGTCYEAARVRDPKASIRKDERVLVRTEPVVEDEGDRAVVYRAAAKAVLGGRLSQAEAAMLRRYEVNPASFVLPKKEANPDTTPDTSAGITQKGPADDTVHTGGGGKVADQGPIAGKGKVDDTITGGEDGETNTAKVAKLGGSEPGPVQEPSGSKVKSESDVACEQCGYVSPGLDATKCSQCGHPAAGRESRPVGPAPGKGAMWAKPGTESRCPECNERLHFPDSGSVASGDDVNKVYGGYMCPHCGKKFDWKTGTIVGGTWNEAAAPKASKEGHPAKECIECGKKLAPHEWMRGSMCLKCVRAKKKESQERQAPAEGPAWTGDPEDGMDRGVQILEHLQRRQKAKAAALAPPAKESAASAAQEATRKTEALPPVSPAAPKGPLAAPKAPTVQAPQPLSMIEAVAAVPLDPKTQNLYDAIAAGMTAVAKGDASDLKAMVQNLQAQGVQPKPEVK